MAQTTANTPILNEILGIVRELKTDVTVLKSEVSTIKSDVAVLKTDVAVLKIDVAKLKDDVSNLQKYNRHQITISENAHLESVYMKLNDILPTTPCRKIYMKEFFPPTGNTITEFDGCIILDSMNTSKMLINIGHTNSLYLNPMVAIREFIIIESKTSVNKLRVDNKIKQILQIQDILRQLPNIDLKTTSANFRDMVQDYKLRSLPTSVNLIFASDDITSEVRQYIMDINNGITKSKYESQMSALLLSDQTMEYILKDKSIKQGMRNRITNIKTIQNIVDLINEPQLQRYKNIFEQYTVPFEELEPLFLEVRGKLGILQFNRFWFPKFTYTPVNNMVGNTISNKN